MAAPAARADVETITKQRDEAIRLLRESPTRPALQDHRYWPWRKRAEAFLEALEPQR